MAENAVTSAKKRNAAIPVQRNAVIRVQRNAVKKFH